MAPDIRFQFSGSDQWVPNPNQLDDNDRWWENLGRVAVGVALVAGLTSATAVQAQLQHGRSEDIPTLSAPASPIQDDQENWLALLGRPTLRVAQIAARHSPIAVQGQLQQGQTEDVPPLSAIPPNRRLLRAEVYTELACNGGNQKGVMPLAYCSTTVKLEGIVVVPRLTAAVPMAWSQRSEIINGRVIRLTFVDWSFEEYRIQIQDDVSAGDALVRIEGVGPILDLAYRSKFISSTTGDVVSFVFSRASQAPSTILTTDILGAAPTYFTLGTVTPSTTISTSFAGDTPLSGAIEVGTQANLTAEATYWISARRNTTLNYYLDLNQLNYTATTPLVLSGKNLISLRRRQNSLNQANRVVVTDATNENALGDNQWPVTAVSAATYIEIDGVNGGISPLLRADALNGYYVIDDGDVSHLITDSVVISETRCRLLMADTTGISVSENVRLAVDSSGTYVQYVEDTDSQATYGIKIGKLAAQSATPAVNWQDALNVLRSNASPITTYDLDLIDLYRLDSSTWRYDALVMGGQVLVVDSELAIANGDLTARIVELTEDHLNPTKSKIVLASRQNLLSTILADSL